MTSANKKSSSRTFSKRMLMLNLAMIWVTVLFSILLSQAEHVVPAAMTAIGALYGLYTGVGHLDYRKALQAQLLGAIKRSEP